LKLYERLIAKLIGWKVKSNLNYFGYMPGKGMANAIFNQQQTEKSYWRAIIAGSELLHIFRRHTTRYLVRVYSVTKLKNQR
jgi:hypothetical protein